MANAIGKYQNWDIKEFMGKKALLGTQVHKLIELFLKNELEGYVELNGVSNNETLLKMISRHLIISEVVDYG